jgi:enoyl-CoA hydratase/carnithine racemase
MSNDVVEVQGSHGELRLQLAAAGRRNSLHTDTVAALFTALARDPNRTVVIESQTAGIFCAGADLKIDDQERAHLSDDLYALYEQIITRPGVVVSLVDGPAVGGGAQLATAADIRILGPSARFRWVGAGHGLAVGAWILTELVGRGAALELTLTSRWVDAEEAVRLGLATSIQTEVQSHSTGLLVALGSAVPEALGRIKRITSTQTLERLHEERRSNLAAWNGKAPTPVASRT